MTAMLPDAGRDSLTHLVDSLRAVSLAAAQKTESLAWGTLGIALLAVLVAPLVQLLIAKKQIGATVLSANRQQWINNLRTQVADFMALVVETHAAIKDIRQTVRYVEVITPYLASLRAIEFNIILPLNPNEPEHMQLETELDATVKWFKNGPITDDKNVEMFVNRIRDVARKIFKCEWERVKTLS